MALIVESGAGLPGAESYASVVQADARCASLGLAAWVALADSVKEVALRLATSGMARDYRARWAGQRVTQAQALCWPRYGVTVDGFPLGSATVPQDVINACIDRAALDQLTPATAAVQQVKKKKIGPIEREFFEVAAATGDRYADIDAALAPYFGASGGSNSIRLVRG